MSHSSLVPEASAGRHAGTVLRRGVESQRIRTYLLQGSEQRDTPGVGAADEALGILQPESYHGWVDHRGWDADGMVVSHTF